MSKKTLIAYYSRKGNNYVNGGVTNLAVGNTEVAASMIQRIIESDMFHIETVSSYPSDYTETTEVAMKELRAQARPELADEVDDMASYDVIFLGYPNWWGSFPMAVATFLESYDFTGKTIIPFCTHEGSGMGNSENDIKRLCPGAKVEYGLSIRGGNVNNAGKDISIWVKKVAAK